MLIGGQGAGTGIAQILDVTSDATRDGVRRGQTLGGTATLTNL